VSGISGWIERVDSMKAVIPGCHEGVNDEWKRRPDNAASGLAVFSSLRLIAAFNVPLAVVSAWLLWRSRDWPLVGDASVFHFIAGQMRMGAVPYRDIADVNMPLTYAIHAAVVAVGGMSDLAWRVFDLLALAVLAALILLLIAPAGRVPAILAALAVVTMHLLMGPYVAGQRDFLMCIPAVAGAWASARADEDNQLRALWLALAGAFGMTAACIKPTGVLLLLLPALTTKLTSRGVVAILGGASAVAVMMLVALAASGGLDAFITMARELLPAYSAMGARPLPEVLTALRWIIPVAGLALTAALSLAASSRSSAMAAPRARAAVGLAAFGLIHLLAQQKGWAYHIYPLAIGLACWGAWALAALSRNRVLVCLSVMALGVAWGVTDSVRRVEDTAPVRAAAAMQAALEQHLPRGARVQTLDADNGAFLAMARAGMRQASPHIQWFSLLLGEEPVRRQFLAALAADPPAAVLLTNAQWPKWPGFEAVDEWPQLTSFLAARYDLILTRTEDYISWRFYLRTR
jgi:hypothetical protein